MIKAIIIDDEQLAIESLQWEIENFCQDLKVIDTFTNPKDAISGVNYLKPDLVFLDIEMPELTGFQLLQALDYRNFDLIITTAYNQYAIQAFKANAVDYLLKPIDPDELVQAIDKVKSRQTNHQSNKNIETLLHKVILENQSEYSKVPLNVSNKIVLVDAQDIMYCKSEGSYTKVYLKNGQDYLISKGLSDFEKVLPQNLFVKTHKSYIVNHKEIKEIIKQGTAEVVLTNQAVIPVSRSHKAAVFDILHI